MFHCYICFVLPVENTKIYFKFQLTETIQLVTYTDYSRTELKPFNCQQYIFDIALLTSKCQLYTIGPAPPNLIHADKTRMYMHYHHLRDYPRLLSVIFEVG